MPPQVFGTGTTMNIDPFWTVTATTGTANVAIWNGWCAAPTTATYTNQIAITPVPLTERAALIVRNRSRAAGLRRKVAERTADALLRSTLTPEQRDEYDRLKRFHVVQDGKTYRIRRGWAGNIDLVEDEQVVERWCVHPRRTVPVPDNLLAQKLMIESGQAEELRRIANVTPMRRAA